ncbi:MAG TPA: SPOR domain-containing protein [Candidatus Aminicenantes bacterium]|nr:SPOR domain-containing protein [Candidatus Aminicenantes bacterium]
MAAKDFREIQVSSSLLVVIFLGVLALGVFIFLLGVSVGKNQARLSVPARIVTQQIPEPVKEPPVRATEAENEEAGAPTAAAPASKAPAKDAAVKAPVPKAPTEAKKAAPAAPPRGLYYVQVLAVADRAQAQAAAENYRKQGHTAVVVDPPPGDKNYKVRLGGFPSRDKAVELRNKLNAAAGGKTDFWVVQN